MGGLSGISNKFVIAKLADATIVEVYARQATTENMPPSDMFWSVTWRTKETDQDPSPRFSAMFLVCSSRRDRSF
jgi:hypothetical protein